jgi:hypothetical protein
MKTSSFSLVMIAAFAVLLTLPCRAGKKPTISAENLAKLQTVKTVFVDGNSESADKLREKMESWTCLKLTNNKSNADAIMTVEERTKPNTDVNKVAASVTITMPNGDQVWSRTKAGEGFVHSGAGMAAENLLHDLAKDVCHRTYAQDLNG